MESLNANSQDTVSANRRQETLSIGNWAMGLTRVYLDINFWIFLREARSGSPRNQDYANLYTTLTALVTQCKAVCPVSEASFIELLRQDPNTRIETARVMDDLSTGLTLQWYGERVRTELAHYFRSLLGRPNSLYPLKQCVWTRPAFVLGEFVPSGTAFEPDVEAKLQCDVHQHLAEMRFEDVVVQMSGAPPLHTDQYLESFANRLTAGKLQHAMQIRSFRQGLSFEAEGALDAHTENIREVLAHVDPKGELDLHQCLNKISELIRAGQIGTSLPFIAIQAGIHACVRWNRDQKFKPHDWMDFMHAAAGLPYCDYFLTERSLARLVCSRQLEFDRRYRSRVFSDPRKAAEALGNLF
jgi:hypothetical protein